MSTPTSAWMPRERSEHLLHPRWQVSFLPEDLSLWVNLTLVRGSESCPPSFSPRRPTGAVRLARAQEIWLGPHQLPFGCRSCGPEARRDLPKGRAPFRTGRPRDCNQVGAEPSSPPAFPSDLGRGTSALCHAPLSGSQGFLGTHGCSHQCRKCSRLWDDT